MRKMSLENAKDWAIRASKDDRCVYYVIKVKGGYDFCQKGLLTPTYADIRFIADNGHLTKL